jgi:GntR family transcriptional regulator/MocR family aminotransferase
MSLRRRLELLEWARRQGVVIFEDDYDSEYRYSGRPVPAMQGLDRANMVIFAGSFSDVLFPALRLGYVVVPPDMIDIFAAAESVTTHHPPLIDQAILGDFIAQGHFARHVRRMRNLYAERLGVLLEEGRRKLSGFLEFPEVEAGLRTVVYVAKDAHVAAGVSPAGRRESAEGFSTGRGLAEQIALSAAQRGVELVPISQYASGSFLREGLMLGFASVGVAEIRRGVNALEQLVGQKY